MNLDFHYYGTYVAARLAGYSSNDSELIAHAAQYVDDSENSRLKDKNGNYYIKDFTPVPTVHSLSELADGNYLWTEKFADEISRVWPVFHFLPGNYDEKGGYKKPYSGVNSHSGSVAKWEYDSEAKEQFKLMCLPNSFIVLEMVNELQRKEGQYDNASLQEIGLRMHSLADTWAHMYYAGIPAWFINEVYEGAFPSPITPSVYYNSLAYLGHLKNWHDPDYPFKKYTSRSQWMSQNVTKDNPSDFMQAFKQMTEALSCIKYNREFKLYTYANIDASTEAVIKKILTTEVMDQAETWKKYIPEIKFNGKGLEVPADYDPDKWLNEYKSNVSKASSYYQFNLAASYQLKFVKNILKESRIFLDDIPKYRTIRCTMSNSGKYISTAEYSKTPWPAPYPTLDRTTVELEFILPNDSKLQCGEPIKIRTTERGYDFGEKIYLGAWSTPALYYYIKDYDIFKQKWAIEQDGKKTGDLVDFSKPVYIKNKHYTDKPYLAPYTYFGKLYLTTSSSKQAWNVQIKQPKDETVGFIMMLDSSGSMYSAMPMVKIDSKAFIDQAKAKDQFAINQFNYNAAWVYPTNSKIATISSYPNGPEAKAAKDAIEKINAGGSTNIGEAISLGNDMIKQATTDQKAFVLLSDGDHNTGTHPDQILGSEPPIYIAGLGPYVSKKYFMSMLAKNSKSRYYHAPNAYDMAGIYNDIRGLAPNSLLSINQFDQYLNGSNYLVIDSNIITDSGEAQISVVWSDKKFKYTSGYPQGNNINVYLINPSGKTTSDKPIIVEDGYCIFNLKNATKGKWKILIQYSTSNNEKVYGTTGVIQFGSAVSMHIQSKNTYEKGGNLLFNIDLFEDSNPIENAQVYARIVQPTISIENALTKYAKELKGIIPDENALAEMPSEELAKLMIFRQQQMNEWDILGVKSLIQPLAFTKEGMYQLALTDTSEAGSYTVEVYASGVDSAGDAFTCTQRRSVLID